MGRKTATKNFKSMNLETEENLENGIRRKSRIEYI